MPYSTPSPGPGGGVTVRARGLALQRVAAASGRLRARPAAVAASRGAVERRVRAEARWGVGALGLATAEAAETVRRPTEPGGRSGLRIRSHGLGQSLDLLEHRGGGLVPRGEDVAAAPSVGELDGGPAVVGDLPDLERGGTGLEALGHARGPAESGQRPLTLPTRALAGEVGGAAGGADDAVLRLRGGSLRPVMGPGLPAIGHGEQDVERGAAAGARQVAQEKRQSEEQEEKNDHYVCHCRTPLETMLPV